MADPARMCLYGFSNGSTVVHELVTRTSRFRCAVSVSPVLTNVLRPALLNPEFSAHQLGLGTVDSAVYDYIALSPVFRLSRVTTPMLIAVGDRDVESLLDAIELFNGL
ncbi:MAG TPA: prolyl oligopeptidase family serine peptidase, partial [Steroidobacteraceae bacterium]